MQTIYLDISNKGVVPTIYAKQGDVGRKFQVILTDSGLPYIPLSESSFSVWYSGASGEGNYTEIGDKSAFSVNGNKVIIEMIVQMLSNEGEGTLALVLNDANGNQISTWNIPYICESVPGANSEEAKDYYTAFSESVQEAKEAAADAIRIAESYGNVGNVFGTKTGNGSVSFSARAGSGITFIGRMKWVQTGEGDPTPTNIRPITVTDTVNVSIADAAGAVQQSHIIALPEPCSGGYVDWARRKYVRTYGVKVITGAENWVTWGTFSSGTKRSVKLAVMDIYKTPTYTDRLDGCCSHYINSYHGGTYGGYEDLGVSACKDAAQLCICDKRFTTVDEYKAYFAEQYAAGTPVTVVYKLANPVEYDLGVLPTLKALDGTTIFTCDTNDGFTVQYNHDELAVANWETLRDRADYVIAEGVSGDWTYRKWSSGIAECWGKNAFSGAVTTAYGNTYYDSTAKNVAFPFTFSEVPYLVVNVVTTDAQIYTSHIIVCNETLFNYYICSDKQQTNAKLLVHAYAVGRWK